MNPALRQLERAADDMGVALPPGALGCFEAYLHELMVWRGRINLTAATTPQAVVSLHFIDSLLPLSLVDFPRLARVADVGSGGGFPGLPTKIVRPDLRVTLIEASTRRVAFLEHVGRVLELTDLTVAWGRAEVLGRAIEHRERFDIVLSRAAARAGAAAELCLPFARVGGTVILLKGPKAGPELAAARPLIERLGGALSATEVMSLPTTNQSRLVATIKKGRPCGEEYPRSAPRLGRY